MTNVAADGDRLPESSGGQIAHFRLLSRLGEGGMGVVYRAMDTKLRREVALKVIHPRVAQDADRRRRFLREGRLAAHLTHPCIATVYEVGESGDRVFIAMELVEGDSLADCMSAEHPLHWTEALRIIHEVVRGLQRAHEVGVIHRDLKPDNVIVGDGGIVKILDFGVAKRLENFEVEFTDIKTQHGSLVGTPAYMSPEQAAGKEVDARSDIFSVGVVMYELVTGVRPFAGDTWQEVIIAINRDGVKPASDRVEGIPVEIDMILARCMAKRAGDRYPSCKELLDDLSALVMVGATGTFPPGTLSSGILTSAARFSSGMISPKATTTIAPPSRGRTALLVGVTAVITVAVGVAFITPEPSAPQTPPAASDDALAPASSLAALVAPPDPAPPVSVSAGAASTVTAASATTAASAPPSAPAPSSSAPTRPGPRPQVSPAPAPPPAPAPVVPTPKPKSNPVLGF